MSANEGPDGSFNPDSNETPSYHPPWPGVDAFSQARFERHYLGGETIDFSSVLPLPFWSHIFGPTESFVVYTTLSRVSTYAANARRTLTTEEANAIAEHNASSARYKGWIKPITTIAAIVLTRRGMKTYRFPMYQPKMTKFDPYSFPRPSWAIWRGQRAVMAWHAVRMLAYLPFAWFSTSFFMFSVSNTTFGAHVLRDPRLAGLIQSIRRNAATNAPNTGAHPAGLPRPQSQQSTGQHDSTPQNYGDGYSAQSSSSSYESASPAFEAPQTAQPSWGQTSSTTSAPPPIPRSTIPPPIARHEDDDSDIFGEEDSPVANSSRVPEAKSSSQPLSAWDRVRQQAKSGNSAWQKGDSSGQEAGWGRLRQDKAPAPRDFTPKADSYTYSQSDEEKERKSYEKERAQKEFDAMLEAERQGDSSNRRGGWR